MELGPDGSLYTIVTPERTTRARRGLVERGRRREGEVTLVDTSVWIAHLRTGVDRPRA
jgi:hypothetical protein